MKKNTPPTDESAIHNPIREKQKALLALEKAKKKPKEKTETYTSRNKRRKTKRVLTKH